MVWPSSEETHIHNWVKINAYMYIVAYPQTFCFLSIGCSREDTCKQLELRGNIRLCCKQRNREMKRKLQSFAGSARPRKKQQMLFFDIHGIAHLFTRTKSSTPTFSFNILWRLWKEIQRKWSDLYRTRWRRCQKVWVLLQRKALFALPTYSSDLDYFFAEM